MKWLKWNILFLILILNIISLGFSDVISLSGKRIAFFLDDKTGNFYLENPNPKSKDFKDLLFKDMPPTSYITLIIDEKPYRLNDSKLKAVQSFIVSDNNIIGNYMLNKYSIRVTFMITNLSLKDYDSIVCIVSAKNNSDKQALFGARFLFDTVYGESSKKVNLYFSSGEKIEYDRIINQENIPSFVFSGLPDSENQEFGYGLFIYPSLNELKPDSMIIGNWKMLDEKEIDYTVNPLARFRYNQFSSPDAAIALLYKSINVKTGEEINFGTILSSSKLPIVNIKLIDAIVTSKILTPNLSNTNLGVASGIIASTNTFLNANFIQNTNLIRSQIDILDRISLLIDKIDAFITNTNSIQQKNVTEIEKSSLGKGLDKSMTRVTIGDPFQNESLEEKSYKSINRKEPESKESPNNLSQGNKIQNTFTNTVNLDAGTNQKDVDNLIGGLKEERQKLQKQYEDKIASLQEYYQNLLKEQENEYKNSSIDYKEKIEEKEKIKNWNQRFTNIDNTLISIDQKIAIIEELLQLDLDFESMPADKMESISQTINNIEKKISNN